MDASFIERLKRNFKEYPSLVEPLAKGNWKLFFSNLKEFQKDSTFIDKTHFTKEMAESLEHLISRRDFLKTTSALIGATLLSNPPKSYAQEKTLHYTIDNTTVWTPQSMRGLLHQNKITFIHWRHERLGNNRVGDRFFYDILKDFGQKFDYVLQVEATRYNDSSIHAVKEVLNEFNPNAGRYLHNYPNYSIFVSGKEIRIRGPPTESEYESKYPVYKDEIVKRLQ